MPYEVTFALVSGRALKGKFATQSERTKRYSERPKITLTVEGEETLESAYDRALRAFGVVYPSGETPMPSFVSFYRDADEQGGLAVGTWALAVPQQDGTARWRRYKQLTYDELVASADAGALNGDPRRPYLVPTPQVGVGNGILPPWETLVQLYETFRQVMELLAAPGGAYATYELAKRSFERSSKSADALNSHAARWRDAGTDPYMFDQWLDDKPWHSADLARLLGCSVDEAEAILWAFGFGVSPSGLWRRHEGEEAKFMADNWTHLIATGHPTPDDPRLHSFLGKYPLDVGTTIK
jgi:hypothetical protein